MNPDDFALSAVELDKIFAERIVLWLFGDAGASADPLLILVGAQPGAGKTRAGSDAIAESRQDVKPIIGDELRLFHPAYRDLLKQSPAEMPAATAQASGSWVERSVEFAAANGISVLVEGTFRNPATTMKTANRFKDAGFTVEAVVVAVSPEISRASIAGRYVTDSRRLGQARFTPLQAHEDAFRALPETLEAIAAAGSPVDRLIIRSRDELLFDAVREGASAIDGALDVARSEWSRALSDAEYETLSFITKDATRYFEAHLSGDAEAELLIQRMALDRELVRLSRGDYVTAPAVSTSAGHEGLEGAVPSGRCGKPRANGQRFCMRRVGDHGCPYHS